ncbi:membrane protein UL121 [Mandrillus leucophaeus cytomegalovirus]|uniref:Membrane protein UL121 n=1 Tax=Mandrillus leucophaeus cytomegalovirus TaxID=1654930 RepID=A0A0G2UI21_9BETA|nr:membrane protein UL121 [Mandrillus leucophaeus cytomegalovirus]AKI29744.1 membrane protein UL121 [Mandrillus leucophaeus cytomegalovirus]
MLRFSDVIWLCLGCGLVIVTLVYGAPFYKGDPHAPTVTMAYIYYNATNLTIYCNTSAKRSRFLASGIMITTKHNTTLIKGGYRGYSLRPKPFYIKLNTTLKAPYGFYKNSTVTCWGSNGTYGVNSFRVRRVTNFSSTNDVSRMTPTVVNETDLVETPEVALQWWPKRKQNQIVMGVIVSQLIFVMFIINACLIWSCKFKRHK